MRAGHPATIGSQKGKPRQGIVRRRRSEICWAPSAPRLFLGYAATRDSGSGLCTQVPFAPKRLHVIWVRGEAFPVAHARSGWCVLPASAVPGAVWLIAGVPRPGRPSRPVASPKDTSVTGGDATLIWVGVHHETFARGNSACISSETDFSILALLSMSRYAESAAPQQVASRLLNCSGRSPGNASSGSGAARAAGACGCRSPAEPVSG
jgi:hypothetical protein